MACPDRIIGVLGQRAEIEDAIVVAVLGVEEGEDAGLKMEGRTRARRQSGSAEGVRSKRENLAILLR